MPATPLPGFVPPSEQERARLIESVEALVTKLVKEADVPRSDADDVRQDVRVALWTASKDYDPRRAKFTTFASEVTRRTLANYRESEYARRSVGRELEHDDTADRKRGTHLDWVADPNAVDPAEAVAAADDTADRDDAEFADLFRRARLEAYKERLGGLSPSGRELVELLAFEGLPIARAAERMGRSLKDAKLILRNALASLSSKAGHVAAEHDQRATLIRHADRVREVARKHPGYGAERLLRLLELPVSPGALRSYLQACGLRPPRKPARSALSPADGERVKAAVAAAPGTGTHELIRSLGLTVTPDALRDWLAARKLGARQTGGSRARVARHLDRIREAVAADPNLTLADIVAEFDLRVSVSTLYYALAEHDIWPKYSGTGRPRRPPPTAVARKPQPAAV